MNLNQFMDQQKDAIGLALDLETTPPFQPQKKFFSGSQSKKKNFKPQKNFPPKLD